MIILIRCPLCQNENPDGTLFCLSCWSLLATGINNKGELLSMTEEDDQIPSVKGINGPSLTLTNISANKGSVAKKGFSVPVKTLTNADNTDSVNPPPATNPVLSVSPASYTTLINRLSPKIRARLIVMENLQPTGESISLPSPPYTSPILLGRNDLKNSLVVDIDLSQYRGFQKMVSRKHISVFYENDNFIIEDLGSAHGTYINKVKIPPHEPTPVNNGDEIRLANLTLKLEIL